ncbi:uncharacterized protein HD556DRAFT_1537350, partial [Suillus plorans]
PVVSVRELALHKNFTQRFAATTSARRSRSCSPRVPTWTVSGQQIREVGSILGYRNSHSPACRLLASEPRSRVGRPSALRPPSISITARKQP